MIRRKRRKIGWLRGLSGSAKGRAAIDNIDGCMFKQGLEDEDRG
jgi:hypothetical protein